MSTLERIRQLLGDAGSRGVDLLLPPHCASCGDSYQPVSIRCGLRIRFCESCLEKFPTLVRGCPRCAAPAPPGVATGERCFRCRERPYRFAQVFAAGAYRELLQQLVLELKSGRQPLLGEALGSWLAAKWLGVEREAAPAYDMLAPMPSHWRRRWSRGCNPAEEIARPVARAMRIPLNERVLRLRRAPRKQGTLTPNQRFENVRGLFRVSRGYSLAGLTVLLVDDVLTTGATASDAARALRLAGARRVDVMVVARGVGA